MYPLDDPFKLDVLIPRIMSPTLNLPLELVGETGLNVYRRSDLC
jgi:hypothetical protein